MFFHFIANVLNWDFVEAKAYLKLSPVELQVYLSIAQSQSRHFKLLVLQCKFSGPRKFTLRYQ